MPGTAVSKSMTIGGIVGEVYSVQLGPPTACEPIDITSLADAVHKKIDGIKDFSPLTLHIANRGVDAGDKATLTITGNTTTANGASGDAISLSIAGWISSANPSTIEVDGERKVSTECEFCPYTVSNPVTA